MPPRRTIDPYCPFRCLVARCFRLACIGMVTTFCWHGAPKGLEAKGTSALRELQFSVYAIGPVDRDGIYYQASPGVFRKLEFWTHERSPIYPYRGPNPLQWFTRSPAPQSPDGFSYHVHTSLNLPHAASSLLLVFIASTHHGNPGFTVHAIDDREANFPIDTLRIFNATGATLGGILGDRSLSLEPGISDSIDLRPFWGAETRIGLALPHMGKLQSVLHSKWTFYPDYRELLLLLPPDEHDSLRIRAYRISEHRESLHPPPADLRDEAELPD